MFGVLRALPCEEEARRVGGSPRRTLDVRTPVCRVTCGAARGVSPFATAASAVRSSATWNARPRAARSLKCARPAFAVRQTYQRARRRGDLASRVSVGFSERRRSDARARRARCCADRAPRSRPGARSGRQQQPARRSAHAARAGASSTMTCALVPLNPNELTPPMRRPSIGSQLRRGRRHAQRIVGPVNVRARRAGNGGAPEIVLFCSDSTSLISPVTPAAASR